MNHLLFIVLITPTLDLLQNRWMIHWHIYCFIFGKAHFKSITLTPFSFFFFQTHFFKIPFWQFLLVFYLGAHFALNCWKISITIKHRFCPWHLHQPHILEFLNRIYLYYFLRFFPSKNMYLKSWNNSFLT